MPKVIIDDQRVVVSRWWPSLQNAGVGASVAVLWWGIWALFVTYIFDIPGAASGVAHVFAAVLALLTLVRLMEPRPLLTILASAIMLWPLGMFIAAFAWYWALIAAIVLFAISYSLFGMLARISSIWVSLSATAVVVLLGLLVLSA